MGYACPVCEEPQVDAEHLANHLAFTAILRSEDHEAWLDEHVPEWGDRSPESLAPLVAERATEVEVDVPKSEPGPTSRPSGTRFETDPGELSARDREILAEARDLTRRMLEETEESTTEE